MTRRIAVFASGGGTNLQALLDHFHARSDHAARVALVISDRAGAGALRRAADAGVRACVVQVSARSAADIAADTLRLLAEEAIDLIVLAGYLKLVPPAVIDAYQGRIINIHPALLPAFGGAGMYGRHVHEAVLARECMVTGVTVHHVTDVFDDGAIIAQWPVPVLPGDTAETLAARVLRVEHMILPLAVELVLRASDTARLDGVARAELQFTLERVQQPAAERMLDLLSQPGDR